MPVWEVLLLVIIVVPIIFSLVSMLENYTLCMSQYLHGYAGGKCNVTGSGNISLGSHSGTKLTSGVCNVSQDILLVNVMIVTVIMFSLAQVLVSMHLVAIVMLLLVIRGRNLSGGGCNVFIGSNLDVILLVITE